MKLKLVVDDPKEVSAQTLDWYVTNLIACNGSNLSIFIGRKGTGKTANLYSLAEAYNGKNSHVCVVKPIGYASNKQNILDDKEILLRVIEERIRGDDNIDVWAKYFCKTVSQEDVKDFIGVSSVIKVSKANLEYSVNASIKSFSSIKVFALMEQSFPERDKLQISRISWMTKKYCYE